MKIKVKNNWQGQSFEVYDIKVFDGVTKFLIYREREWQWVDANMCVPEEPTGKVKNRANNG